MIIVLIHYYGLLNTIYPIEIGIISFCIILAVCILMDGWYGRKAAKIRESKKTEEEEARAGLEKLWTNHWKLQFDDMESIYLAQDEKDRDCDEILDKIGHNPKNIKQLSRRARLYLRKIDYDDDIEQEYDAYIWTCFNIKQCDDWDKKLDNFTIDFFVIHFILLGAVFAFFAGYVAMGIINIINGETIINSYADLYQISAILIANVFGGYKIIDNISVWFFDNFPAEQDKRNEFPWDKIDDDYNNDEDDKAALLGK